MPYNLALYALCEYFLKAYNHLTLTQPSDLDDLDTATEKPKTVQDEQSAHWVWLLVALLAHSGWGIAPVFSRYFQVVVGLPSMSLLAVFSLPLFIAFFIFTLPKYGTKFLRSPTLWIIAWLHTFRVASNLLAAKFTEATFIQLIGLTTPFMVVILSWAILRERAPKYTKRAILLTFIGAVLVLSADVGASGLSFDLTRTDFIGMSFAVAVTIFLSLYMIMIRKGAKANLPPVQMLIFQGGFMIIPTTIASLALGEDWSKWRTISPEAAALVALFTLVVTVLSNTFNINAIARIGAPAVSSLMPWRLIITLILAWVMLGERLDSVWQVLGAAIVFLTVTWYLWMRRTARAK